MKFEDALCAMRQGKMVVRKTWCDKTAWRLSGRDIQMGDRNENNTFSVISGEWGAQWWMDNILAEDWHILGDLAEGVPCRKRKPGELDPIPWFYETDQDPEDDTLGDLREHVDTLAEGFCARHDDTEDNVADLDRDVDELRNRVTSLEDRLIRFGKRMAVLESRMALVESLPRRFTSGPYSVPCVSDMPFSHIRRTLDCIEEFLLSAAGHFSDDKTAGKAADLLLGVTSINRAIAQTRTEAIIRLPATVPCGDRGELVWRPDGADNGTGSPPPQQPSSVCKTE